MPSGSAPDGPPTRAALAPRPRLPWLRSQGLGLACGFATVMLLAVGSVVITATRDGASAGVQMDDLRGFFDPPRLAHLWLYLLFPVAGLYAVNTVLATWDTVRRKWRAGLRAPGAYAASIVHVGFLLALVAHGVGGFLGRDGGVVLVGPGWQELPGFGEARLISLEVDALPGGMPRAAWARLEVRDGLGGGARTETVGYNAPLSAGGGAALALLSDFGQAWIARLVSGEATCALADGQGCVLGGEPVRLVRLVGGRSGPAAVIAARAPTGREETRVLSQGGELPLAGGRLLELVSVTPEQVVALRLRETPGHPWALAAGVVMALGIALLWRRLVRSRSIA